MEISVELTLAPLQANYEEPIIRFIRQLRTSGLKVVENPLSTQVYGEYDKVMLLLQEEIKTAFGQMDQGLIHIKIVKSDRSDYEPDF